MKNWRNSNLGYTTFVKKDKCRRVKKCRGYIRRYNLLDLMFRVSLCPDQMNLEDKGIEVDDKLSRLVGSLKSNEIDENPEVIQLVNERDRINDRIKSIEANCKEVGKKIMKDLVNGRIKVSSSREWMSVHSLVELDPKFKKSIEYSFSYPDVEYSSIAVIDIKIMRDNKRVKYECINERYEEVTMGKDGKFLVLKLE